MGDKPSQDLSLQEDAG